MKDHLKRLASDVDSAVALGIALIMSVLGLFSVTSNAVMNNSILITLTVLAFCLGKAFAEHPQVGGCSRASRKHS